MNTRIQIQKRKQIRLKQIIDEQTQNLRNTLDELTLSEDNLRTADTIKEKLIRVLAHDIRSPMISTIYLSNHIKDQLESLPKADLQEPIHLLDNVIVSQTNILNYANDFLAWYNVSNNLVKPNLYDVNIHEVIGNILKMYAPIIELNNNKLSYANDQELWVKTDANFLSIIIRNLIDNANKNTKSGRIEIQLKDSGDQLDLLIINDATGSDPVSLDKMKHKINSDHQEEFQHLKLGLILIKNLSKHLDLPLSCNTDDNTVTIGIRFNKFWYSAPKN